MPDEKPIAEPEDNQTGNGALELNNQGQVDDENQPTQNAARGSWLSRRNIALLVGIPLALVLIVALVGYVAVRNGFVARRIEQSLVLQLDKIGLRSEIGSLEQTFAPLGVQIRDLKLYDKETGELLATVASLKLDATVTDLYALNLNRTIRLDGTEIDGLEAFVKFDEQGRSNFSRLIIPEQEESNLRFTYETMRFSIKNSTVHYGDLKRKLSGEARNVALLIEPDEGLSETEREIENRRFKFDLSAANSNFTVDDKPIEPIDVRVRGVATETYATISELNLKTPFLQSTLKGRLENWENLKYRLEIVSTVDLQQADETLRTELALRGIGNLNGVVEGEGANYKITDAVVNFDALAADNIRLQGLRVNASVAGENDVYQANGEAVAELLTYEDFQLNALQIAGNIMGTGTDFRFLGDLQSAAAKFPGGSIASLILNDAVAEYKDSKLTAEAASVQAASLDAFDAKVRNARLGRTKVTNANGVTDAAVGNLRADSVQTGSTSLRGVSANNVKVRNRDVGATTVNVGNLTAQNLRDGATNVNNLSAGNVGVVSNNGRTTVNAGNVAAGNVQQGDTKINDVRASGVEVVAQNGRTTIDAGNFAAGNVQTEGVTVRGVEGGSVNVINQGSTTDVIANNLNVGGLTTADATLGSINIAGARLRIVGSRILGSTTDINAGNITLNRTRGLPEGGRIENVRAARPTFVVEPSGRYRASADLSLGGGVLGSIRVGAARAQVTATNGQVDLQNLNANVLEGNVNGSATITYAGNAQTRIAANFDNVDVSKILALTGGQVVPVSGRTSGTVDLSFPGLNYRRANGSLNANVTAEAGNDERGRVPVTGNIGLRASNGLFDVETARFNTEKSEFTATGRFDLEGNNSNLQLALDSTDAGELQRIISVLNVAPGLDKQLADNKIELAGNFSFIGTVTGNLTNPNVEGRTSLQTIRANNRDIGSLATDLALRGATIELRNGLLAETNGGTIKFDVTVPNGDTNNIAVNAQIDRINIGNVLAAAPLGNQVPAFLRDIRAEVSGAVNLTGVPANLNGTAEINSTGGSVSGESFDALNARVAFANSSINIERFEARAGEGAITARGNYDAENARFNLETAGTNLPIQRFRALFGENPPNVSGTVNFTARGTGDIAFNERGEFDATDSFRSFDINFDGTAADLAVDERAFGNVAVTGRTQNQLLTANVTATVAGQQQTLLATLNFGDETLPFRAETSFDNTDLSPLIAIAQPTAAGGVALGGRATGRATFGGNLRSRDANGNLIFSTDNLRGEARFSQLALQVEDVILAATDPLAVRFSPTEVQFENAEFTGSGSNFKISGTAVFAGGGSSNLAADGTLNLRILNAFSAALGDSFFGGLAEVSARFSGTPADPRLIGSARLNNASFTTTVSEQRLTATNINGRVLFNANQAQIESLEGNLGGGRFTASGGALLNNLQLQSFRVNVRGDDISAPLPGDIRATADADIQASGVRRNNNLVTQISGRVFAQRIEYFKDFEIADFLATRDAGTISTGVDPGDTALGAILLDVSIEGRDALVVRNNVADLTGSLNLRVTGNAAEPLIAGRVTATGGTLVLLNEQRYDITRATVDFPGQADASPVVNFQGESDINGYQVFLGASGPLSDPQNLNLVLRSNPPLPQADVVALVTTGNLSSDDAGGSTLAQTGLNTAADVITDAVISAPIRRATDRLFGLNRFEIDPTLANNRGVNPGARLTVGRQINRNLSLTYSTNLSGDQNQVIAFEYRVSNRVSLVAQYQQAPNSNVTNRNNNFNFEVRFRRRF